MQLVTDFGILTAVAPLSKDNAIQGQSFWKPKQSLQKQVTVIAGVQQA